MTIFESAWWLLAYPFVLFTYLWWVRRFEPKTQRVGGCETHHCTHSHHPTQPDDRD